VPASTTPRKEYLRLALANGTPRRAARLALTVGPILVLINQWEVLTGTGTLSIPKLILTLMVPYLVSTYTSVTKDLESLKK